MRFSARFILGNKFSKTLCIRFAGASSSLWFEKLENLNHKFRCVFAEKLVVAGAAKLPPVKIPMVTGSRPRCRRTRRYSPAEKEITNKETKKMLTQQAIEDAPVAPDEEIYNKDVVLVGNKETLDFV